MLEIGDKISVAGGIHKKTNNNYVLNLEMLHILKLVAKTEIQNPICNVCKKRMKSIWKKKGFECEKCGKEKTNKIKFSPYIKKICFFIIIEDFDFSIS